MYIKTIEVGGLQASIKGMRNPLDSWDKSDSHPLYIGDKDIILAKKLIKAGTEHRKFLRQIQVWADVKVPRYIWQELDTYKFGTKNSCSTMHTIKNNPITIDDFYLGDNPIESTEIFFIGSLIPQINYYRDTYLKDKDYKWVKEMKRILPESFLQLRTWNTNYEELRNIYHQRKHHKLNEEWGLVCNWIESLPYSKEFITDIKGED